MIKFDGKIEKFPNGESKVTIPKHTSDLWVDWLFEGDEEIFQIMLICDAAKRVGRRVQLIMPFIPYQQQDRVMNKGEAFSLKVFTNLLKTCDIKRICVSVPHSDVAPALLDGVTEELTITNQIIFDDSVVIVPDAGAYKRLSKLSNKLVVCNKHRNVLTGEISGTKIDTEALEGYIDAGYTDFVVVDDICIRGGTFIPIANTVKSHPKWNNKKHHLTLQVTHGIFPDGKEKLLDVFDKIEVDYDFYELKKEKTQ